jgi:hypothetical protein
VVINGTHDDRCAIDHGAQLTGSVVGDGDGQIALAESHALGNIAIIK